MCLISIHYIYLCVFPRLCGPSILSDKNTHTSKHILLPTPQKKHESFINKLLLKQKQKCAIMLKTSHLFLSHKEAIWFSTTSSCLSAGWLGGHICGRGPCKPLWKESLWRGHVPKLVIHNLQKPSSGITRWFLARNSWHGKKKGGGGTIWLHN